MNLTDDPRPWYGKGPKIPDRAKKIFILSKNYSVDGEDITQMISIGLMTEREAWVDTLPEFNRFNGMEEVEEAFAAWNRKRRTALKHGSTRKSN